MNDKLPSAVPEGFPLLTLSMDQNDFNKLPGDL
jgi:hypothetical protein